MAEATTVMDPAAAGQGDEPATQVSTIPTTGPMAVLYRVTGGQSLRQVLPAVAIIIVALVAIGVLCRLAAARAYNALCLAS